jgi:hypothetical protein
MPLPGLMFGHEREDCVAAQNRQAARDRRLSLVPGASARRVLLRSGVALDRIGTLAVHRGGSLGKRKVADEEWAPEWAVILANTAGAGGQRWHSNLRRQLIAAVLPEADAAQSVLMLGGPEALMQFAVKLAGLDEFVLNRSSENHGTQTKPNRFAILPASTPAVRFLPPTP